MKTEDLALSQIHVRLHPELRDLIVAEADAHYPDSVNDVIARALAKYYKRPDLAAVPRKRMGRPPKVQTNGTKQSA